MTVTKWLSAILFFILIISIGYWLIKEGNESNKTPIIHPVTATVDPHYSRADKIIDFNFPKDHGPHPDYQTEWWYFTGNLESEEGYKFGYQLTFFRRSLVPRGKNPVRESNWATPQIYMAHFAISNIESRTYHAFEKFSRGAIGLAGANATPFEVWLGNWRVSEIPLEVEPCNPNLQPPCQFQLNATQDDVQIDLVLKDTKGPILQGNEGFSPKGSEPGQASYYYSLTRLESKGTIQIGDRVYLVTGLSWMDHEFSTSALSNEQTGWDWFSFQFKDGSELMLFQIRRSDGRIDPFSSGTWIASDGETIALLRDDFSIDVGKTWRSTHSQAIYPSNWDINIPKIQLNILVEPYFNDQELNVSYAYWEGAVKVSGSLENQSIEGSGYVELTGYSQSMGGEF